MRRIFLRVFVLIIFSSFPLYAQPVGKTVEIPPSAPYAQIDVAKTSEALNAFNSKDEAIKQKKMEEVMNHPENFSPPVLYGLAYLLFEHGQKDDAVFWLYVGVLRGTFDANLCKDESAKEAIGAMNMFTGSKIFQYSTQDLNKLEQVGKKVLEWDQATPFNYDQRWINLHGMGAMTSSLEALQGKRSNKQIDMSAPKSQWEEIHRKTREDFFADLKKAI